MFSADPGTAQPLYRLSLVKTNESRYNDIQGKEAGNTPPDWETRL